MATGEFIPIDELFCFWDSVDAYVAHMILSRVGRCVGMVEDDVGR